MAKETGWGVVAGEYKDSFIDKEGSYHATVILPNLLRIVDPKPGMKILEVGCGDGYFTTHFAQKGAEVVGSDIAREMIDAAKKREPKLEWHVAPADQLSFAKDNFFGSAKTDNVPQSLPYDEVLPPSNYNNTTTNDNSSLTSQKLQDATLSIDSAQVEIRKNLSVTQQKYAEIDKNYIMVKTERKLLKQQIKDAQKRLNALEKTKKKIKNEMGVVNN